MSNLKQMIMKVNTQSVNFNADKKLIDFIQKRMDKLDMYYDKWLVDEDVFCIKDDLNDMVEYIKYRIE